MFAVILHDAGVLNNFDVLDCPCNGRCPHVVKDCTTFDQVDRVRKTDPVSYERMLCWDYAYNVGYVHGSADHAGPLEVDFSSQIPVIADQPNHEDFRAILDGNSPNHGLRGQNVLFGDGSVRWFHTRRIGPHDPDVYLNNNREPRPGVHVSDSVLMPSKIPFHGRENTGRRGRPLSADLSIGARGATLAAATVVANSHAGLSYGCGCVERSDRLARAESLGAAEAIA